MKGDVIRYLYGGASLSLLIRVGGVGLLFLANVVLARSLSQATYGLYAYIVELVALASVVAALGFDQIAIRTVPDFLVTGNGRGLRLFIASALSATIAMGIVIGGLFWIAHHAGAMPASMTDGLIAMVVLLLCALTSLRVAQESLRAGKRIVLSQMVEQLLWPLALLGAGCVSIAGLTLLSLSGILALQLTLYGLASIPLLACLLAMAPATSTAPHLPEEGARQWLSVGAPLALAAAMSVVLNRGDILALGIAVSAQEIAPYTAASRYAALLILGLGAASAVAAAVMREYWRVGDRENLQHAIDRTSGIAALFALPLAAIFVASPDTLLSVYGPGYVAGDTALRLLALAQLINALTGPVAVIVIVCDLTRAYTFAMAGAVALQSAMLAILIPPFGVVGAGWASLLALAVLNVGLALLIKHRLGLRSWVTPGAMAIAVRDLLDLRQIVTKRTP